MEEKLRVAMFGQKRLSREGGIEIVVKELCTRMARAKTFWGQTPLRFSYRTLTC